MKALFILLMIVALGILCLDDNSKRSQLAEDQTREAAEQQQEQQKAQEAAEQQQIKAQDAAKQAQISQQIAAMSRQIQDLTTERDQLKIQVARLANVPAPTSTPSSASWLQQRVNGAAPALDQPAQAPPPQVVRPPRY